MFTGTEVVRLAQRQAYIWTLPSLSDPTWECWTDLEEGGPTTGTDPTPMIVPLFAIRNPDTRYRPTRPNFVVPIPLPEPTTQPNVFTPRVTFLRPSNWFFGSRLPLTFDAIMNMSAVNAGTSVRFEGVRIAMEWVEGSGGLGSAEERQDGLSGSKAFVMRKLASFAFEKDMPIDLASFEIIDEPFSAFHSGIDQVGILESQLYTQHEIQGFYRLKQSLELYSLIPSPKPSSVLHFEVHFTEVDTNGFSVEGWTYCAASGRSAHVLHLPADISESGSAESKVVLWQYPVFSH